MSLAFEEWDAHRVWFATRPMLVTLVHVKACEPARACDKGERIFKGQGNMTQGDHDSLRTQTLWFPSETQCTTLPFASFLAVMDGGRASALSYRRPFSPVLAVMDASTGSCRAATFADTRFQKESSVAGSCFLASLLYILCAPGTYGGWLCYRLKSPFSSLVLTRHVTMDDVHPSKLKVAQPGNFCVQWASLDG